MVFRIEDAEDVVQQVAFITAKKFSDYDQSRPFIPWVLGIARKVAIDHNRKMNSRNTLLLDNVLMEKILVEFERTDKHSRDITAALDLCIERLTKRARNLLNMRYARDMQPQDIADRLSTTANTVSVTLSRIRKTLRECIDTRLQSLEAR